MQPTICTQQEINDYEGMVDRYRRMIANGGINDVRDIRDEQEPKMGDDDSALLRWSAACDALADA